MITIRDEEFVSYTSEVIYQKLLEGVRKNEFLFTYGLRAVGKSTALVRLARELDCAIIVNHYSQILIYKNLFGFSNVYYQGDSALRGMKLTAICDEDVDYNKFENTSVKILTGFTNRV